LERIKRGYQAQRAATKFSQLTIVVLSKNSIGTQVGRLVGPFMGGSTLPSAPISARMGGG
jgi:hypothetical protein